MILLVKPEAVDSGFSLDMALKTEPLELASFFRNEP